MRNAELQALTGIRFYAAFFVFLSHASLIPGMERYGGAALIFNAGVVGVCCFFVLSGFILTYNYASVFQDGVSGASYRRFVWDRWTKIYPVHFAMLLFMIPLQIRSPNLPLDWRAVPFHLFLVQCFWPVTHPTFYQYLNVPSWSISCEWFFYLVAPVLMYFVLGTRQRWLPVLVMAVYASGLGLFLAHGRSDFGKLYLVSWFAPSRVPEFLTGVYLAQVFLRDAERRMAGFSGILQAAGILLIVVGADYRAHAPWPFWGGLLYLPGSALLVLGLAYGCGFLAAHLCRPFVRRLGMASFCLYMMQAPVLRTIKGIWMLRGWEVRSWAAFWIVMAGTFVLIQGAALFVHDRYEMPMQRRLRSLLPWGRVASVQPTEAIQNAVSG